MFRAMLYKDGVLVTCPQCHKFGIGKGLDAEFWSCKGCKPEYTIEEEELRAVSRFDQV